MAARTLTIAADCTVSLAGHSFNYNGQSLGVGMDPVNFDTFRSFLKFNLDWTDVKAITSATVYMRSRTVFGTSPDIIIKRVTSTWNEAVTWDTQPTSTASNQVASSVPAIANNWFSLAITAIVRDWAPVTVTGGGANTNYGIGVYANSEANSADYNSFYDRESAYDAYIVLSYTLNSAPTAPDTFSPTNGAVVASTQPVLSFKHHDPDGDSTSNYSLRVGDAYPNTGNIYAQSPAFVAADGAQINAGGGLLPVLTRGSTYYWYAATKDGSLWGPYNSTLSFKVGALPTASVTSPVASAVAEVYYTAGTNLNPKLRVRWSYADTDGHAQKSVAIKIYADSAGSPGSLLTTETYTGSGTSFDTAYVVVADTKYHVSVTPTCSLVIAGVESAKKICRVRYGRASYYYDATSTPGGSISASSSTTVGANASLVLEYATSAGVASEPTTWYSTVAGAGKNRYLWHRVTLLAWGASPVTAKLNSFTWSYSAAGLTPDNWTMASVASIDLGTYVYGTQSLKHDSAGVAKRTYQAVTIRPDTDYVLSGRIKTTGAPNAQLRIEDPVDNSLLASATATSDTDWTRYVAAKWNSGGYTSVNVVFYTDGASSTAWTDALKFEASAVVTPWSPGFVGSAVVVDAGGLSVDASAGGTFRLRDALSRSKTIDDLMAPNGWLPYAFALGDELSQVPDASQVVAASGGAILVGFYLAAPMKLQSFAIQNRDTTLARAAEWRLYADTLNTGTLYEVAGANGTFSFTAAAVAVRESDAASAPVTVLPGTYWVCLRTTNANSFAMGMDPAGYGPAITATRLSANVSALGATLATSSFASTNGRAVKGVLRGRIFGETVGY